MVHINYGGEKDETLRNELNAFYDLWYVGGRVTKLRRRLQNGFEYDMDVEKEYEYSYYEDGKLKEEYHGTLLNDDEGVVRQNGTMAIYRDNGRKAVECKISDLQVDKESCKVWDENGNLKKQKTQKISSHKTRSFFIQSQSLFESVLLLFHASAAEAPAVLVRQHAFFEFQLRLNFHDAELGDAGALLNGHVFGGVDRHFPPVALAAVAGIYDANGIGLEDLEVLEGGTAGSQVRLVALGQLHGNAQMDQLEFTLLQGHSFCSTKINPIGLSAHISKAWNGVVKILDSDFL